MTVKHAYPTMKRSSFAYNVLITAIAMINIQAAFTASIQLVNISNEGYLLGLRFYNSTVSIQSFVKPLFDIFTPV